jgi:hypothetical protein
MEGAKQLADDPEIKLGVHMELNRIERALKNNWDTWPRLKQARALSVLHRGDGVPASSLISSAVRRRTSQT